MRSFHLHLVSDATGETCITIARAAAAQFQGVDAVEHLWSLVRTESQLRRVLAHVEAEPGVVMFTLVDPQLRALLLDECQPHRRSLHPAAGYGDRRAERLSRRWRAATSPAASMSWMRPI